MNQLYFEYQANNGSKFVGYIYCLEIDEKGIITIYLSKDTKTFTPNEGDIYRCGESYRWTIVNEKDKRWFTYG